MNALPTAVEMRLMVAIVDKNCEQGLFAGTQVPLYDGMSGRDRVAVLLDLPDGKARVSLDADLASA